MEARVMNDYDRIAKAIDKALTAFTGNAHEPPRNSNSDSITMTKDGFITGVIRFQRLRNHVEGLAETHRTADHAISKLNQEPT
jgi:hypothetical protein